LILTGLQATGNPAQWRATCQPFFATAGTRSMGIKCRLPVPDTLRKLHCKEYHNLFLSQDGGDQSTLSPSLCPPLGKEAAISAPSTHQICNLRLFSR